jgi:hypothetical protein
MEYEEIKTMWEKYDNKLNNLEKINKKLIRETLLKKPRRKLNWHKFQNIYGLIALPVIIIVALHPDFKRESLDLKFLIGCILTIGVIIYVSILNFKSYSILKRIDLDSDTVLESASKVADFKKSYNFRWKHAIVYYPLIYAGGLLITWKGFNSDTITIVFLIALFVITYIMNIIGPKLYRDRIQRLEKEIINLKEYTD